MHTLHRIRIRLFCPSSTLLFSSVLSFISSNLLHRKPFHNLQRVHLPPRRDLCPPTPIPTCRSVHSHSHTLKPGRRQKFSKTMRRSPSHFIFKVGKRQGGGTLIQSSQLLYDVTILDTLADSYLCLNAASSGAATEEPKERLPSVNPAKLFPVHSSCLGTSS